MRRAFAGGAVVQRHAAVIRRQVQCSLILSPQLALSPAPSVNMVPVSQVTSSGGITRDLIRLAGVSRLESVSPCSATILIVHTALVQQELFGRKQSHPFRENTRGGEAERGRGSRRLRNSAHAPGRRLYPAGSQHASLCLFRVLLGFSCAFWTVY